MSWRDMFAALARRWYVVLLGFMLTAGLVALVPKVAPPEYTARGLVLLLPPQSAKQIGNPFLELGGLDLPARVLVAYYSSNSMRDQITAFSPDADTTVSIEESTRSPVIAIDVVDSSPEMALKTLRFVADSIPDNLAQLQAGVQAPENARVRSMPLTMDERAEVDLGNLIRAAVAAAVLGLAVAASVALGLDGLLRRRRTDLDGAAGHHPEPEPHTSREPDHNPEVDSPGPMSAGQEEAATAPVDTSQASVLAPPGRRSRVRRNGRRGVGPAQDALDTRDPRASADPLDSDRGTDEPTVEDDDLRLHA